MKIKVCGMRRPDNIDEVAALGIDMAGFIFYQRSPRFVGEPDTDALSRLRAQGVETRILTPSPGFCGNTGSVQSNSTATKARPTATGFALTA